MTALLGVDDYREPPDCPFTWGDGYDRCTYHDLPVHRCLIQGGHDGACLCMCLSAPPPTFPQPQRFTWVGWLDECGCLWVSDVPCVPGTPVAGHHMCVDGDDRVNLGHEPHHPDWHTCRCGNVADHRALERLARRERRYRRDLERS